MQASERIHLPAPSYEGIVRHCRDVIAVVGVDGRLRFVNDAAARVLGRTPTEAQGEDGLDWVHADDRVVALERRAWMLEVPGRQSTSVLRVRQSDGSWRHVETRGINLMDDPHVQGLLYLIRDVEDRARAEVALVQALAAQRTVAELGLSALRSTDVDALVQDALDRVRYVLGAAYTTLLLLEGDALVVRAQAGPDPLPPGTPWPTGASTQAGRTLAERSPTVAEDLAVADLFAATPEQAARGVVSGADVLLEGSAGPLGVLGAHATARRPFGTSDVQFLQGVANVLAGALERDRRERSAVERALHDPLTGLPTRPLFEDRFEHALSRARRGGGEVAVLLVDLDRFKAVNDTWGHAAGDEVLRVLGPRLAACTRASDTLARYGGDEFVVLCEEDVRHVDVSRVAAALRRACTEPFVLPGGESVLLSGSVGIGWSADEGPDAAALLRAADAGMYRDKWCGPPV